MVVDGGLIDETDFSEGARIPRAVLPNFSDTSEGGGLADVAREAYDSRDSVDGRKAGYVRMDVVSRADERELEIVLARELASVASFDRFGGCGRGWKSFSGGGGATSLAFDDESGISGIVSTGGTNTLDALGDMVTSDLTSDSVSVLGAEGAES